MATKKQISAIVFELSCGQTLPNISYEGVHNNETAI